MPVFISFLANLTLAPTVGHLLTLDDSIPLTTIYRQLIPELFFLFSSCPDSFVVTPPLILNMTTLWLELCLHQQMRPQERERHDFSHKLKPNDDQMQSMKK